MDSELHRLKYQAAIFDLDGTLADTLPLIYTAFNEAVEPLLGRTLEDAEIRAMFGPPDNAILRSIAAKDQAEQAIVRYISAYNRDHSRLVTLFDGISALLHDAREAGIKLAVVTGKSRITATYSLEQLGIAECFEVVYSGDDVTVQKPDPEALIAALRDLSVRADRAVVMIGDSAADILAGQAAGIATIGVLWGSPDHAALIAAGPDTVCATVDELRSELGLPVSTMRS